MCQITPPVRRRPACRLRRGNRGTRPPAAVGAEGSPVGGGSPVERGMDRLVRSAFRRKANIRTALSLAPGSQEPDAGRELAALLARWWIATGRYSEASQFLTTAAGIPAVAAPGISSPGPPHSGSSPPFVLLGTMRVTEPSPTAIPGHGQPKDAVVIARAYSATATTACANGHGPDGLADEERQSAACPVIDEEASHDQ